MWQVLRADRPARGLGYRAHPGPGASVHYSSAAAAAPDGCRSFCLSRGKLDLQQLNRRLAAYLQQVKSLEAANQTLERQIQEELDRKCPAELRQLDQFLEAAALLQRQIRDGLSDQAQVKLQLLGAELTVCDFTLRCDKERERRGCLEAELSDLRVLEEVLKVHTLPELRTVLDHQRQQLLELQMQHNQDRQALLAQLSGGVSVEVQAAASDLSRQLEHLRQTSGTVLDKNQNESWSSIQLSMLGSPEVTFDPAVGSEVVQAELQELRRTAASLEEELAQLQALKVGLEASGLQQVESAVQQLAVLQQRADGLCGDLDLVLQAAARQAEDHDVLLDTKSRLETEIGDYRRLLDGLNQQQVSSLPTSSPSAFRRNNNRKVRVQGGNLGLLGAQTASRGHIRPAESMVQSIRVHSKHPNNSPSRSINSSNLTGSFHKPENQRTGSPSGMTGRESKTVSTTIRKQSHPMEDRVHTKETRLTGSQISQVLDQALPKPETFTPKQVTTGAGLQTSKTETRIQTEITKSVVSAETEVQEDPESSTPAQITCTEGSIRAKNQEPAGVVSLSPETPAEAAREDVVVTASIVSGSDISRSEAQGQVSADGAAVTGLTPETNTAQATAPLVPDTQPALSPAAQAKPGASASTETPAKDGSLANKTGGNTQTEISKTVLCVEPEATQGSQTDKTPADPSREEKKEPEAVVSVPLGCTEASIQAQGQDPAGRVVETGQVSADGAAVKASTPEINTAQAKPTVVPDTQPASDAVQARPEDLRSKQTTAQAGFQENETGTCMKTEITKTSLCAEPEAKQGPQTDKTTTDPSRETGAEEKKEPEAVSDPLGCTEASIQAQGQDPAGRVVETESAVSDLDTVRSEGGPGPVPGEVTLVDDKDPITEENKGEVVEGTLSDGSNSQKKREEDAETGSGTEILKEVEVDMKERKSITGCPDPTELDKEVVNPAALKALLSPTKPNKSVSLTDSGVALSPSDHGEILSPSKEHVFEVPTELLPCLSPVEAEVLMSLAGKAFHPVDQEERVRVLSPDSLFSPNDSDTCLSPAEVKGCLSPSGEEEDEEACLGLTEAIALVRPVEKYVLSTKEEAQTLSFGRDQGASAQDTNRKVSISVKDGDSLCFGSFEGDEGGRGTLNGTTMDKPASRGAGFQLGESGGPVSQSVIADKEKQLGFGGLYRKSVRDMKSPRDVCKDLSGTADSTDVQNPGGRYGFEKKKENSNKPGVFVKSASFDRVPASRGSHSGGRGNPQDLAASFGGTAGNSSGAVSGTAEAATTGRFRRGSGDWMVYGTLSSKGSEESSAATVPVANRPETGRFGSRGSGEWAVYGGSLGRKSSLTRTGSEESPPAVMQLATSPPDTGRFGSGGQVVYSCNIKRSDSVPIAGSRESQSAAINPAASPPGTGRFGSTGSGEWKFYGGSSGRMSGVAGGEGPPSADSEESPSGALQLATSPPGTGRFGSTGSGEWKFYGGSSGRLSRDGSTERVSANKAQVISPPSSYTGSGPRLSSSVVRRSSSVGSGGRLSSSSGNHRASSSGRFTSTGSGERKPVYSSASGRRSSAGSAGRPAGGGATSSQRAPSPGGRVSTGSGGWLSTLTVGGNRISSSGSGSKVSGGGSNDRISGQAGGRISSSSGSGRTNSTGGRAISSSDRPIRSTGSGASANKERISVCKMAALSISAAGRERSQDRRRQQQQQQAAASSPLVQRWLTTGVGVTSTEPDGLDDIVRL